MSRRSAIRFADKDMRQHKNLRRLRGNCRESASDGGASFPGEANTLISLASPMLKLGIVEIGQLPLYNQDLDDDPPAQWTAFRERIKK
jgi:hypothetical protein